MIITLDPSTTGTVALNANDNISGTCIVVPRIIKVWLRANDWALLIKLAIWSSLPKTKTPWDCWKAGDAITIDEFRSSLTESYPNTPITVNARL